MCKVVGGIMFGTTLVATVVSLAAALWSVGVTRPVDGWSEAVTARSPDKADLHHTVRSLDGETTAYQMMLYADRPILRSEGECRSYLRIRNAGEHPLELTGTYVTNRRYTNGRLTSEEIGNWPIPGAPIVLLAEGELHHETARPDHEHRVSRSSVQRLRTAH